MSTETTVQLGEYQITTIVTDKPWCVNCYLVRHLPSEEQILIDPGDALERILATVQSQGTGLKKILITHAHHDHVGAVAELYKSFEVPCYVHKADARLMCQAHTYALVFDGRQIDPFTAAHLFEDNKIFNIGHRPISVIYSPGHTMGSVCYNFGDFVFTGDTVLYQHVGRSDTPGASLDQLKSSVSRLVDGLSGETVIFPGHGRRWTIAEAKAWWEDAILWPPQYNRFGGI
jgi:glyoxylase-like metal-dependent hydrolase (beta-lactamase superfamily II)